ncbi:MAG: hypothetical protein O7H40_12675, partial [Gammaproteobacteria bacterium]|nr:hypothetical protein [Gammaproteobacteria bacterium]
MFGQGQAHLGQAAEPGDTQQAHGLSPVFDLEFVERLAFARRDPRGCRQTQNVARFEQLPEPVPDPGEGFACGRCDNGVDRRSSFQALASTGTDRGAGIRDQILRFALA